MSGKVYLIGAGPGGPELMTLKAARALGRAEVVLVDELVNRGCLAHARSDAKVIEVGKRGGCKSTPQSFIEKLMIQTAKSGHVVARLKGGDPFVFGRGGEELGALVEQGIEVEVIPGITAGLGVTAALGIPVTHRGLARGVTFVTGHTLDGEQPDWNAPARIGENGTLKTQRQRIATLGTLTSQGFEGPAIIVIGEVVRFSRIAHAE